MTRPSDREIAQRLRLGPKRRWQLARWRHPGWCYPTNTHPCSCGLSAFREAVASGDPLAVLDSLGMGGTLEVTPWCDYGPDRHYRVVAENAELRAAASPSDEPRDEGWAIAIISNVDAPEAGWPHQTQEWRDAARNWLDSIGRPLPDTPEVSP